MYKEPYFFKDNRWYRIYLDKDNVPCVKLTNDAPQKAIDSYNEYFKAKNILINFEV